MDKLLSMYFRMLFKAVVISMVILDFNHNAIWAVPLGLIIGIGSEAENITKK